MHDWAEHAYAARSSVKQVEEKVQHAKRIVDPVARRDALAELKGYGKYFSDENEKWIDDIIKELTVEQAAGLWQKVQEGDANALFDLIVLTQQQTRNHLPRFTTYRYYTGAAYVEPEGWQDAVASLLPNPTLDDLRMPDMESGEVLLLAATALRESSLTKAKIVLAYWKSGQGYQRLIPQDMIDRLVTMVERRNAEQKSIQTRSV